MDPHDLQYQDVHQDSPYPDLDLEPSEQPSQQQMSLAIDAREVSGNTVEDILMLMRKINDQHAEIQQLRTQVDIQIWSVCLRMLNQGWTQIGMRLRLVDYSAFTEILQLDVLCSSHRSDHQASV